MLLLRNQPVRDGCRRPVDRTPSRGEAGGTRWGGGQATGGIPGEGRQPKAEGEEGPEVATDRRSMWPVARRCCPRPERRPAEPSVTWCQVPRSSGSEW